jgi:hypothetical protein
LRRTIRATTAASAAAAASGSSPCCAASIASASRSNARRPQRLRVADAIDAAQHGLDPDAAAAAEAAVVARIVRRKSVMALRRIDAGHVWSTSAVSASAISPTGPSITATPDTAEDTQGPAEPVISGWTGPRVSGSRRPARRPRHLRPARTPQASQTAPDQPEPAPQTDTPNDSAELAKSRKFFGTKVLVPAMRAAYPDMTAATIADKIGVAERTVRRYLPATDVHFEHANDN